MGDIRITNAALGDSISDEKSRTSVKFTYSTPQKLDEDDEDDEEDKPVEAPPMTTTTLCSLTPGKVRAVQCGSGSL